MNTALILLDFQCLLSTCEKNCVFHNRLIQNIVRISAMKSLNLSSRMMHIAPKSIRGRLLSYLSEQAEAHRSPLFMIPFSRQQLADYLGVDRSALSNELSKILDRFQFIIQQRMDVSAHKRAPAVLRITRPCFPRRG